MVSARPTTTITIGSGTYTARAPKYQVWLDVVEMLDENDTGNEAMRRLSEEADTLTPAEQRELMEQANAVATFGQLHLAIIYGVQEPTGRRKGGFLRRCLRPEDFDKITAELDDDDSELDVPDLYAAAMTLRETFDGWFQARSETMGMPVPKPPAAKTKTRRS